MMRIVAAPPRRKSESTIALINIVFLMLIFFLIAGSLAPPVDKSVQMIDTLLADPAGPPDALAIRADGTLTWHGQVTTLDEHVAMTLATPATDSDEGPVLRILADRNLPAPRLLETVAAARASGIARVLLVTEQRMP